MALSSDGCHHSFLWEEREREKSNNYSERLYIFPEAAAAAALDFLANHSLSLSSLRRFFSAYQDNRMLSCLENERVSRS